MTIMVSPLAVEHQSRRAGSPSEKQIKVLMYMVEWGGVRVSDGITRPETLRALADFGYAELDTHPTVKFRVTGARPTDRGRAYVAQLARGAA